MHNFNKSMEAATSRNASSKIIPLVKIPQRMKKIFSCYLHKDNTEKEKIVRKVLYRTPLKTPVQSRTPIKTPRAVPNNPLLIDDIQVSNTLLTRDVSRSKKSWYIDVANKIICQGIKK